MRTRAHVRPVFEFPRGTCRYRANLRWRCHLGCRGPHSRAGLIFALRPAPSRPCKSRTGIAMGGSGPIALSNRHFALPIGRLYFLPQFVMPSPERPQGPYLFQPIHCRQTGISGFGHCPLQRINRRSIFHQKCSGIVQSPYSSFALAWRRALISRVRLRAGINLACCLASWPTLRQTSRQTSYCRQD